MAVCDAHCVFTLVNMGDFSSNNDSVILQNSALGGTLGSITLGILDPEPLEYKQLRPSQKMLFAFVTFLGLQTLTNSAVYCPNGFVYSEEAVDNLSLESGVLKCQCGGGVLQW